ncbi:tachylectin-related carbohydrate-binding protein [Amycolatopsis sp. H20-H5]|uniref:tachylectin-related carbohydrate-binding protein n=1 Tax=Amycolatopsis sp. H20-H5 TaxID=3046309 RepID=UPI002DB92BA4|nr:tachylectin-related carbohydrate-binding protein [Amycolatopsis sp. H20-H5]MEC3980195.1 tachylectin-related carbohydrate-binding protein [Amycolatopsis sp. H20-H5]
MAPISSYGFTAKLMMDGRACSGALVSSGWVITAANCFPETPQGGAPAKPTTAIVGRTDLTTTAGHVAKVTSLVVNADRGIALAGLDTRITDVAPVALGTTVPAAQDAVVAAGFGRAATEWVPDLLHTAAFTVTATTATGLSLTGANGNDACKGDSGGPVVREQNGIPELLAILGNSWQHGCIGETETRQGTTASRTDDLADWIRRTANPDFAITCKPAAPLFSVQPDGNLTLQQHTGARDGTWTWTNGGVSKGIGNGWLHTRAVAGPDGVIYSAVDNGELRRLRWNGNGWDRAPGATADYTVIDHGWERYSTADYRNRITVDALGNIYTVEPDGNLHWRAYDPVTKISTHRVLTADWGKYNLIVAAGDGVIYARTPAGDLFRGVYDATANTWTQTPTQVGSGWNKYNRIFSVGADTLYTTYADEGGGLLWNRYLPASKTWYSTGRGVGKLIGQGWYNLYDLTATTNSCTLIK